MRSAWGSVDRLGANRWRVRWWGEGPDGYRRRSEVVRGTRMDACDRLAQLQLLHGRDAPAPTVGRVWLDHVRPDLQRRVEGGEAAPRTLAAYDSAWARHVAPKWAEVPVDAVRPMEVQSWLLTMTLSQAQTARVVLSSVMGWAERMELREGNPMRAGYSMPAKSTSRTVDPGQWSVGELAAVASVVHGLWWEGAFLLMAYGGLRVGEALGVMAEDVEPFGAEVPCCVVRVERQLAKSGPTERVKTASSARAAVVVGWPADRVMALSKTSNGLPWLTGDGLGGPTRRSTVSVAWDRLGLPDGLDRHTMRSLRRTWETTMRWSLRLPPHVTEPLMGHVAASGGRVTAAHYDRPGAEQVARVVADAYADNMCWGPCPWD